MTTAGRATEHRRTAAGALVMRGIPLELAHAAGLGERLDMGDVEALDRLADLAAAHPGTAGAFRDLVALIAAGDAESARVLLGGAQLDGLDVDALWVAARVLDEMAWRASVYAEQRPDVLEPAPADWHSWAELDRLDPDPPPLPSSPAALTITAPAHGSPLVA